jgi:hypothetical protein
MPARNVPYRWIHALLKLSRKVKRDFHIAGARTSYRDDVMRRAFVLQLGPGTEPARRHFEGCIEEVDTGREVRFRSVEELVTFLGECFQTASQHRGEADRETKE